MMNTTLCACGSATIAMFVRRDRAGTPYSCWIRFASDGAAVAGCDPDERTAEVLTRRAIHAAAAAAPATLAVLTRFPGDAIIRCSGCSRRTRVLTSNLAELRTPLADPDPIDSRAPVSATACWLAIDDAGETVAGCTPDHRTADVLERRAHAERRRIAPEELWTPPSPEELSQAAAIARARKAEAATAPAPPRALPETQSAGAPESEAVRRPAPTTAPMTTETPGGVATKPKVKPKKAKEAGEMLSLFAA